MRVLSIIVTAYALTACTECNSGSQHAPEDSRASATRTVAEVDGPVDALVGARDVLFGLSSSRGVVFAVTLSGEAGGSVRELSAMEKEPFAVVVRAGSPVWASREGVFVSDPDGKRRQRLVTSDAIHALASSPHGIVYSDGASIWRVEWPQAAKAIRLAEGVSADELVATDEAIVWLDRGAGEAWALDLKSGAKRQLAQAERRPHDLSLSNDGHAVAWHEGEADLLPGRAARAFLADTLSGAIRELPGAYESASRYLLRGSCAFGPAECKPVALVDWTRLLDTGPPDEAALPPVADDAESFFWVAPSSSEKRWRIVSARKDACCR
jgi:hypothetical protein